VLSINAGLDMIMVPYDYKKFISALKEAVQNGDVAKARIDDAVRRILNVKLQLGLFERPFPDPEALSQVGAAAHRAVAREAVRKSLVLLKNENKTLPLSKSTRLILVAGQAADDIGFQCGGWTIEWAGNIGQITPGTTILGGLKDPEAADARIEFDPDGNFGGLATSDGMAELADVGIVVLAEPPYSEGAGDRSQLTFDDNGLVGRMRGKCKKLVLILLSGRPMVVTHLLPQCDAFVAAWLPGSEANGISDVLFGDYPFTGKLPFTWPRSNDQLPFNFDNLPTEGADAPLFPFGYGLAS
jgi:beta-glucosidase